MRNLSNSNMRQDVNAKKINNGLYQFMTERLDNINYFSDIK